MNLRQQSAADLQIILEDSTAGFGWPITVIDPMGNSAELVGFTNDIAQTLDPQTGQAVSGRNAQVQIAMAALEQAGLGFPRGIADKMSRPWVIKFSDLAGNMQTFKVSEGLPDRTLGVVKCLLEAHKAT